MSVKTKGAAPAKVATPSKTQDTETILRLDAAVRQPLIGKAERLSRRRSEAERALRDAAEELSLHPTWDAFEKKEDARKDLEAVTHEQSKLQKELTFKDFKPCVDVQKAFISSVQREFEDIFQILLDAVDEMDKQILIRAMRIKFPNGNPDDDYLQPGEFIDAILFVLGAGTKKTEVA